MRVGSSSMFLIWGRAGNPSLILKPSESLGIVNIAPNSFVGYSCWCDSYSFPILNFNYVFPSSVFYNNPGSIMFYKF